MTSTSNTKVVLTIAGSDPSGGAGIQADLKTFAAHGCYGASIIAALTAQNTKGVQGVHPIPPQFVGQQIDSVLDDLDVTAIKTGMLYDAGTVKVVAKTLQKSFSDGKKTMPPLVCDPVCVSTSGHQLLHPEALNAMISVLFPLATVITPNKSEAELLLSETGQEHKIGNLEDMLHAAQKLTSLGCQAVLLKGGHIVASMGDVDRIQQKSPKINIIKQYSMDENMEILLVGSPDYDSMDLVVDILHRKEQQQTLFVRPRIDSSSTHGTGCTLSSAIACGLAKGSSLEEAVAAATVYTHLGIQSAVPIGSGHGPLNHLHNVCTSLIPRPTPVNPYPFTRMLIERSLSSWKEYVQHEFVRQLGKGTLDKARFVHFIKQDYLYLKYYARAYGLLAAKSTSFRLIARATETIGNVLHEVGNHKAFCATFDITEDDLESTREATATTAYGAYIIDIGLQGDVAKLTMALMACLLGYGEVGLWLKKQSVTENSWVVLEGNPYRHWMEEYSGKMYQDAVRIGLETIEALAVADPPSESRLEEWMRVWESCTRLEKGFWDMAMNLQS